jgi:hypothetical protein
MAAGVDHDAAEHFVVFIVSPQQYHTVMFHATAGQRLGGRHRGEECWNAHGAGRMPPHTAGEAAALPPADSACTFISCTRGGSIAPTALDGANTSVTRAGANRASKLERRRRRQSDRGLEKLAMSLYVQLLDGLTYVLGLLAGTHQQRIIRFHNDEVLNTHRHHELAW